MRQIPFLFALTVIAAASIASLRATELEVPARRAPAEHVSMQKGPPNCARWTDECVNCTRGADDDAPVCSNIGIACQPKAIRCVSPAPATK